MTLVSTIEQEHVRVLRLDRSDARNAMNTALVGDLLDAVGDAVADDRVRVIVLTAVGASFSVGADLHEELDKAGRVRRMELLGAVFEAFGTCPKPTVAAVAGHCIGSGAEIAAACDIRVADPTATFRFPGAALGYPVGPAKLVGLIGLGAAKELVLTSRTIDVAEARHIGFIQRVAGDGAALATALDIARDIARHDPEAVAYLKRMFAGFSGLGDRIVTENDALQALTEADGDYAALTAEKPGVGSWAGGAWASR